MVVRLLPALLAMSISSFGGEAQMLWVTVKDGGKLCIAHTREVSCSEVPRVFQQNLKVAQGTVMSVSPEGAVKAPWPRRGACGISRHGMVIVHPRRDSTYRTPTGATPAFRHRL
jgi:hypothetical protein